MDNIFKCIKNQNDISLIIGKKGRGKTHLLMDALQYYEYQRMIILDPHGGIKKGFSTSDFKLFTKKLIERKEKVLTYVCGADGKGNNNLDLFFDLVFNDCINTLVVIDEIEIFATTHSIHHYLKQIIQFGRNKGLSVLATGKRAANIHNDFFGEMDNCLCFQIHMESDIEKLASKTEFGKKRAEKLSSLDKTKFQFMMATKENHLFEAYKNSDNFINDLE